MSIFKEFLDTVASGTDRCDLFLFAKKTARDMAQIELFNEAGALGLCPIVRSASHSVLLGHSRAVLRIAHPYIDREMKGIVWSAMHGLDTLDGFDGAVGIAQNLLAMVR